jgi:uncharacterized protein YgbK (DUF1537 family)
MQRLLAIADDLTGAAEIAGVGWRHGLPVRLLRQPTSNLHDGLTVIDTDSRLLPPEQAARAVRTFVDPIAALKLDLVYKKTDSVLRGPVGAEIDALLDVLNRADALLVPQNPSRGRTIAGGIYSIDGVPLDQTSFKDDPDHPARSSRVGELIPPGVAGRITVPDASTQQDIARLAGTLSPHALPAGGADFFAAILQQRGLRAARAPIAHLSGPVRLFVCGSASAQSQQLIERFRHAGLPVRAMPDDVFGGAPVDAWVDNIDRSLSQSSRALVVIARPVDRTTGTGARLQQSLAEVVAALRARQRIDTLLLEGGATASAVCRRMAWHEFDLAGELGSGAVLVSPPAAPPLVAVKPGSYAWPDSVWRNPSTPL